MADSARSYGERPPHGTMAEEAVKLAEVAHLWLVSRAAAAEENVWAEATRPDAQPPECTGCPYCRVRRALGNVSPEVYGHLGDAVGSLAAALRALAKDTGRP